MLAELLAAVLQPPRCVGGTQEVCLAKLEMYGINRVKCKRVLFLNSSRLSAGYSHRAQSNY